MDTPTPVKSGLARTVKGVVRSGRRSLTVVPNILLLVAPSVLFSSAGCSSEAVDPSAPLTEAATSVEAQTSPPAPNPVTGTSTSTPESQAEAANSVVEVPSTLPGPITAPPGVPLNPPSMVPAAEIPAPVAPETVVEPQVPEPVVADVPEPVTDPAIPDVMPVTAVVPVPPVVPTGMANSRPNIILVMTDDQGMGDLSGTGNEILRTPRIDAFAEESTSFTDFHVSPTCAPTRSAMMSGRRAFEVGVTHTIRQRERMALAVTTFPEVLQGAGYKTALFGKWHLGDEEEYLPQNRGFDEVLMHGAGGIGQGQHGDFTANEKNVYFDNVLLHNDTIVQTKGFCTDLFFDSALAWIKQQKDTEEPYFAYVSLNAPHGPMHAPNADKRRFAQAGYDNNSAARYGMIENIDANFGRMMDQLKEWQALENTLVIFMTDNGMSMAPIKQGKRTLDPYNAGLKGRKNSANEGGTHVPAYWYWKDRLGKGVKIDALVAHLDLYRTFAELAGAEIPETKLTPLGRSMVPLMEDPEADWADRKLFIHRGRWNGARGAAKYQHAAVRTQRWRLVFTGNGNTPQLSDIAADPGESKNVAGANRSVVNELKGDFDQWWDSLGPLLVNENLPTIPGNQQPFNVRYRAQAAAGGIPDWAPDL